MSTHRHARDPQAAQLAAFHRRVAGVTSAITGPVVLLAGLIAGSPWIAAAGGLMLGIPAVAKLLKGSSKPVKPPRPSRYARYRAWRRSLTPGQRLALDVGTFIALTATHIAWHHHNQKVSARLTASVMGTGPKLGGPGLSGWRGPASYRGNG